MKRMSKILFATALVVGAALSTPTRALSDNPWCNQCDATGACVPCCVCSGLTFAYCSRACS
jgi:hypothetical protein